MADSRTEPAFVTFLRATIEALSHRLSDKLLKTTLTKSMKTKKFETNFKKGWNLLTYAGELAS